VPQRFKRASAAGSEGAPRPVFTVLGIFCMDASGLDLPTRSGVAAPRSRWAMQRSGG
jgi:hypothetical protein